MNQFHDVIAKRILVPQRVALKQFDVSASLQFFAGKFVQVSVDLDGQDRTSCIGKSRRQRADAGADLQYTTSVGRNSAELAIKSTRLRSIRKFCP